MNYSSSMFPVRCSSSCLTAAVYLWSCVWQKLLSVVWNISLNHIRSCLNTFVITSKKKSIYTYDNIHQEMFSLVINEPCLCWSLQRGFLPSVAMAPVCLHMCVCSVCVRLWSHDVLSTQAHDGTETQTQAAVTGDADTREALNQQDKPDWR